MLKTLTIPVSSNNPAITLPTLHQPLHSKVANYLNGQRRSGQYCDLILELENQADEHIPLSAHFCVVAAQSEFIGGPHFQQGSLQFSIQNPLKVTITNFNCSICLQTMLDFFYEDIVTVAKEHEEHFKQLAKMLLVQELLALYKIAESTPTNGTQQSKEAAPMKLVTMPATTTVATDFSQNPDNDIKLNKDYIFDEKPAYFKLKNPRAPLSSSKINYCIGCDFKCYRVQDMISHMSSCEASHLTCSLCEVGFLKWREYDEHLRKHSQDLKKPFFCLDCNIRFMTRGALILHYPKHSLQTPHICDHCGKGFKWKQGLTSHMLVHQKVKQMLCDVCGYSTTHLKALKSHKLTHTGELFKCTYPNCNHRANRKENLKLHMDTHKQERPFVCEICGCKFSQSKNLKRHALKHETQPGSSHKYKCQLCSFGSHRSDKVKEHTARVHTEKAIQLELPEIVENAFETSAADGFDLPPITNVGLIHTMEFNIATKKTKPAKMKLVNVKDKSSKTAAIESKKLQLLAPKLNVTKP